MATLDEIRHFMKGHHGVAELKQDLFVLSMKGFKNSGFFVEFGLMDGITASNSYVMERDYNWNGIVCEPARVFHDQVVANRKCTIDFRAVTDRTGDSVEFKETDSNLGLSTILKYSKDMHAATRKKSKGQIYNVTTVSLIDLLDQHNAPHEIDYISMDTEGSELAILESFDFSRYQVDIFTIEHNWEEETRKKIFNLMESNGYLRVLTDISQYDDWYIHNRLIT